MNDIPDAPWIVESWYTGPDPDYEESPYERCSENDFLNGADDEYGFRILAWVLGIDEDAAEDPDEWQGLWNNLTEKARRGYCRSFEKWNRDDAADFYNQYWRRQNED